VLEFVGTLVVVGISVVVGTSVVVGISVVVGTSVVVGISVVVGTCVVVAGGLTVEENCQSQVPCSSPTAAMPNLFSLITLALSSVAVPVIILSSNLATGEL